MGRPHRDNTALTEVHVLEDPSDQICAVEIELARNWVGEKGWGKVRCGKVKVGKGKVCKGERGAFRAIGDYVSSAAAVTVRVP
jgi:hypothetical protein